MAKKMQRCFNCGAEMEVIKTATVRAKKQVKRSQRHVMLKPALA